jgi:DNA-binding Xre family transcriptional regulator
MIKGKKMADEQFKKRVRWAINKVAATRGLTNRTIAPVVGVTPTTVSNYRTMKNEPKSSFINKFCDAFSCNSEWIMTGKGRPFFDLGDDYEDDSDIPRHPVAAAPLSRQVTEPRRVPRQQTGASSTSINVDEAMGKTYKVLTSGTPYAVALYLNIQQFSSSLDTAHELSQCKERLEDLQDQVDELRRQVDRLSAVPDTPEEQEEPLEKEAM